MIGSPAAGVPNVNSCLRRRRTLSVGQRRPEAEPEVGADVSVSD